MAHKEGQCNFTARITRGPPALVGKVIICDKKPHKDDELHYDSQYAVNFDGPANKVPFQ